LRVGRQAERLTRLRPRAEPRGEVAGIDAAGHHLDALVRDADAAQQRRGVVAVGEDAAVRQRRAAHQPLACLAKQAIDPVGVLAVFQPPAQRALHGLRAHGAAAPRIRIAEPRTQHVVADRAAHHGHCGLRA